MRAKTRKKVFHPLYLVALCLVAGLSGLEGSESVDLFSTISLSYWLLNNDNGALFFLLLSSLSPAVLIIGPVVVALRRGTYSGVASCSPSLPSRDLTVFAEPRDPEEFFLESANLNRKLSGKLLFRFLAFFSTGMSGGSFPVVLARDLASQSWLIVSRRVSEAHAEPRRASADTSNEIFLFGLTVPITEWLRVFVWPAVWPG